jgi:hypothetical protein
MQIYRNLDLSVLLELLANQTTLFTKMLTAGYKDHELTSCQHIIEDLQAEIDWRKREETDASIAR